MLYASCLTMSHPSAQTAAQPFSPCLSLPGCLVLPLGLLAAHRTACFRLYIQDYDTIAEPIGVAQWFGRSKRWRASEAALAAAAHTAGRRGGGSGIQLEPWLQPFGDRAPRLQ